jgi:Arc/MetJ family transcription regulator
MRATIAIDDELFAKAQKFAGGTGKSAVINVALQASLSERLPGGLLAWDRFRRG